MSNELFQFSKFASFLNKSEETHTVSLSDIQSLENILKIKLPNDFKLFMNIFGNLWTPHILDIIVENEIEMNDIQQFWPPEEIIDDKKSGITNQLTTGDLIAFATDCMGNIYAFKSSDIKISRSTANVYFFDLDFETLDLVADSFTELIKELNSLI